MGPEAANGVIRVVNSLNGLDRGDGIPALESLIGTKAGTAY